MLARALRKAVHKQPEQHAVQCICVRAAEALPSRARTQTPHPGASVKPRNAIRHALFHENFVALESGRGDGIACDARARNKNASGGSGGSENLCAKKRNAPTLFSKSGRSFLRGRVYTDSYYFVKRNLKLFLFFLELPCFQEHSSPIPQPILPCAASARLGPRKSEEDTCRII